jgi:hypothetical protein
LVIPWFATVPQSAFIKILLAAGDTDSGGQGSENRHNDVDDGFPGFFLHNKFFILDVSHRACSRSAKLKQAWFCSR